MRHKRTGKKLGRSSAHREAMLMNMAGQLIEHGRIRTTEAKAKALRPYVERLVTKARTDTLHSRRNVMRTLRMHDKATARDEGRNPTVKKLFDEIAPRFADRPGGYTRIIKLGPRPGDAAPMAFIEWVDHEPTPRESAFAEAAHSHEHAHAHA